MPLWQGRPLLSHILAGVSRTGRRAVGEPEHPKATAADSRASPPRSAPEDPRSQGSRHRSKQVADSGVASDGAQNSGRGNRMCAYGVPPVVGDLDTIQFVGSSINSGACGSLISGSAFAGACCWPSSDGFHLRAGDAGDCILSAGAGDEAFAVERRRGDPPAESVEDQENRSSAEG